MSTIDEIFELLVKLIYQNKINVSFQQKKLICTTEFGNFQEDVHQKKHEYFNLPYYEIYLSNEPFPLVVNNLNPSYLLVQELYDSIIKKALKLKTDKIEEQFGTLQSSLEDVL